MTRRIAEETKKAQEETWSIYFGIVGGQPARKGEEKDAEEGTNTGTVCVGKISELASVLVHIVFLFVCFIIRDPTFS